MGDNCKFKKTENLVENNNVKFEVLINDITINQVDKFKFLEALTDSNSVKN